MALEWRPIRTSDLKACLAIAHEPVAPIGAWCGLDPVVMLHELLCQNKLGGAVVYEADKEKEIVGFGTDLYLDDETTEKVVSGEIYCVIERLFDPKFRCKHVLDLKAQECGHRGEGVNGLCCFSGWLPERIDVLDTLARSASTDLVGIQLKRYYKQTHSPDIAQGYADCFRLPIIDRKNELPLASYPASPPIFIGVDREGWGDDRKPAQKVNEFFDTKKPSLRLSPRQRQILQLLLMNPALTDAAVAQTLASTRSTVSWQINQAIAKLFGEPKPYTISRAGREERRRQLMAYLQKNLQELRPWVNMPDQCT